MSSAVKFDWFPRFSSNNPNMKKYLLLSLISGNAYKFDHKSDLKNTIVDLRKENVVAFRYSDDARVYVPMEIH